MGLTNSKLIKEDIHNMEKDSLAKTSDSDTVAEVKRNTQLLERLTDNVQCAVDMINKKETEEKNAAKYDQQLKKYEETITQLVSMVMKLDNENQHQEARLKQLERRVSCSDMEKRVNEIAEHMGDNKDANKILGSSIQKVMMASTPVSAAKSKFKGAVKKVITQNEEKSVMKGFMDSGYEEGSMDNKTLVKHLMNMKVQASVVKAWQDVVKKSKATKN